MSPHSYHPQGFTPGSVQSIRAVQMEHRYENKTSYEQQAACNYPLGRRNLAHAWQAQMDARNEAATQRQLGGRKSAAALEWLLKRQQERTAMEQTQEQYRPMRRGAGSLSPTPHCQTSVNNPLLIKQQQQQQPHGALPTPAEMAAALAAMELLQANPAAAAAAAASLAAAAAPAAETSSSSDSCSTVADADPASADGSECSNDADSDAVAVIGEQVEAAGCVVVPVHLRGHMAAGSMVPEDGPAVVPTPYQTATEAAYWCQQEMDELMSALLEQYPHGIPKKMLLDLRQLGISDAPGLGFGCPSSSLDFDICLLKPM